MYLTPRYDRAAVKASWNVFERSVTGIPSTVRVQNSGVQPYFASPPHTIEKQRVRAEKVTQSRQKINAMPRNKISDDLDHVKKDLKPSNPPKGRPPDP